MKTIIIHHLQEMWDGGLRNLGTSFEDMLENTVEHLELNHYDKIIVTNFEAGFNLDDEQMALAHFYPIVYEYGYGWDKEMFEDNEHAPKYVDGGSHSEVVVVDEWMEDLRGDIYLCGAFDGECIEDMEIALRGAGKEFKRIENLIV